MWRIKDLELVAVAFDFQSSGQALHQGRSLLAEGIALVNDIELADFTTNPLQVIVCDACGIIGCASGNWVVMRRLGVGVLWIPDFRGMCVDDFERWRLAPPEYIRSRGVPFFAGAVLARLQSIVPLAPLDRLPILTRWEAARLLQWEAPGRVLGQFPEAPAIRRDFVLAVDPGDATDQCRDLNTLLAEATYADAAVDVPPLGSAPISFYLDLPGTPEWQPIARAPAGEVTLNFAESYR